MASGLRPLQEALGAELREVAGASLPGHYGDAAGEYRAVREGAGVIDRSDLAVLRMWGKDPVKMLQGLITNDLAGAAPGHGVYAAMLTPKGRMIADLRALARPTESGTEVLITLPREALEGTTAHLRKFVPPMFARWEDASARMRVIGVYGPRARSLISRLIGTEAPTLQEDAFVEISRGDESVVAVATRDAGGEEGFDLVTADSALPELWEVVLAEGMDLGARAVGYEALDTLRIEAGRPRYGQELTEETIPTEAFESTGLLSRAISFTKGCYTGQEVIVRIAHRGHVNRHLRGLRLGDAPAPAARTPLFLADGTKEVGWTTSATHSPLLGETVALGYLRREVGVGGTVRLGGADGAEASVAALPFEREG